MADYFGLEAIGKRMDVSMFTILRWIDAYDFIAYKRGSKHRWYTNDTLINTWEIARASRDRQKKQHRKRNKAVAKAQARAMLGDESEPSRAARA